MFRAELTLEGIKNILIPSWFPHPEDGDPQKYIIDMYINEDMQPIITIESVDDVD